jgi:hypothetical protein
MDIKEIVKYKDRLNKEITNMIRVFETETSTYVSNISLDSRMAKVNDPIGTLINVDIEVSLK